MEIPAKYLSPCWLQIANEYDLFRGERKRAGCRRTLRIGQLDLLAQSTPWTDGETEAQIVLEPCLLFQVRSERLPSLTSNPELAKARP